MLTSGGTAGRVACAAMADEPREAIEIEWTHDGEPCRARVGEPVRWKPILKGGHLGPERSEGTVERIVLDAPRGVWVVYLELGSQPRGAHWANPFLAGSNVRVVE